jgi:RNA polymerase sigma factor, sigma-70 family
VSAYEEYKKEIYRIGWRVQYKARKVQTKEFPLFSNLPINYNFTASSDTKIWVEELLSQLPSQERTILIKLYLQDMTENEVAKELHISQQAVSKWKKKLIQTLSQIANF